MKNKPVISIIAGAYNGNRNHMIEAAIDSVIKQSFTEWEFIICDDASTDGTLEIVKEYEKKDSRIIVIENQKNKGLAYSLNHCLEYAKGEYIARMDLDDISDEKRLEKQYKALVQASNYGFCGTCADFFNDNGKWGERKMEEFPQKDNFLFTSPFIHASILAHRELYEKIKYQTGRAYRRCEDYDLFFRWYAAGFNGFNMQSNLYYVRLDNAAYARRKYKERFFEAYVRAKGFYSLHLLPRGIPYIVKPLIVGLLPQKLLNYLRKDTVMVRN